MRGMRAKMRARNDKSLELIGNRLRDAWRDLVTAPLPDRIQDLLEALRRMDGHIPPRQGEPEHRH